MFIPPKSRLFSGSEEGTAAFSAFWVLISNELWITMSSYKDVQQCWALWERCTFFFNNTRKPDGGWLAQAKTRKISFHSSSQWLTEFLCDKEIRKICKSFSKILDHESQHLPAHQPWAHCPLSSIPLPKLLCFHRHILQPECLEHLTGSAKPLREKKNAQLFPF